MGSSSVKEMNPCPSLSFQKFHDDAKYEVPLTGWYSMAIFVVVQHCAPVFGFQEFGPGSAVAYIRGELFHIQLGRT